VKCKKGGKKRGSEVKILGYPENTKATKLKT
jgi:hypothetical protein